MTVIIRTSERRDFLRCQQRWWWAWREGLRLKGEEPVALWFGALVHDCLAQWYSGPGVRRGPHPAETFAKLIAGEVAYLKATEKIGDGMGSITEERLVSAEELGLAMLNGYVEHWGRDDSWHVIKPEQRFQLDIPHWSKAKIAGIMAGTYDLVYRDLTNDYIYLGEHKTAKSVRLGHLPLDPQAGTYWTVAGNHLRHEGLIGPKEKLRAITYNFLRKALPDMRPRNEEGHFTNKPLKVHFVDAIKALGVESIAGGKGSVPVEKATLAELEMAAGFAGLTVVGDVSKIQPLPLFVRESVPRRAAERQAQITRLQGELQHMQAIRDGKLPILKNPTTECEHLCVFHQMCVLHEAGADWEDYRDAAFKVQDPYADHRKTTEGVD